MIRRGRRGEASCPSCGRPLAEHDRDVRFRLPDPVLDVPEEERRERTWGGDQLLAVLDVGAFVRTLLPVRLTGGYSVTFGTWLHVSENDVQRAWEAWDAPAYADLALDGTLANALPPWPHVLGAEAVARVRDRAQFPYIVASGDPGLHAVLADEWPHEPVLAALP